MKTEEDGKEILEICFYNDLIGKTSFFESYFKVNGNGYFFLFKKNLRVTNIQFAELLSLLKRYSHSEIESNVGSKFHFFTAPQFNNTIKELKDAYIKDTDIYDPDNDKAMKDSAKHFAETYFSLFQHIVILDPYYTSCSIFIPPFISIDLKSICGMSGYIHSCGSHIYVRNINKCDHEALLQELKNKFDSKSFENTKRILFTVYAHEDFAADDQNFQDGSANGLHEVKIYEEKCFMGQVSLVNFIKILRDRFNDRIYVPNRGSYLLHKKALEDPNLDLERSRTLWLIMDKKINMNNMKHADDTSYYICYEQRYLNANQFQLFDENKFAWKSNTTLPHSLCSAMLNIALQNVSHSSIEVCDPFLGSGTTFFETQKYSNINFSGFDIDPLSTELFDYNLNFFLQERNALDQFRSRLSEITSQVDIENDRYTGNLKKDIDKIESLLHKKSQGEYEFTTDEMLKIHSLSEKEKVLFYLILRIKIKYDNQFIRKGTQYFGPLDIVKEINKIINPLAKYRKLYEEARSYTLSYNASRPDLLVWQGDYSENISVDIAKLRQTKSRFRPKINCGKEGDVLKLKDDSFDIIVTDPPYGFNTLDETVKLGTFYNEFLERLLCALRDNGQLLICLPEKSFSGKISPFFTHKEIVFNRILSICNKKGYELVAPIHMVPNRELFRPPFYWNAEKALSRSILHFRIRKFKTASPLDDLANIQLKRKRKPAIFIIGPSGSGKTTLADFLRLELNYKKISGGDLLRKLAKSDAGPDSYEARRVIAKGGGANDDLIVRLYTEQIETSKPGIIFDGNPSGENQAKQFLRLLNDYHFYPLIIKLDCSVQTCVERARKNKQRRNDKSLENIMSRISWYNNEVTEAYNIMQKKMSVIILNAHDDELEVRDKALKALNLHFEKQQYGY